MLYHTSGTTLAWGPKMFASQHDSRTMGSRVVVEPYAVPFPLMPQTARAELLELTTAVALPDTDGCRLLFHFWQA